MRILPSLLAVLAVFSAGCNNAGEGALTGAGVGALSGLAIGSLSGNAGKGAAIGAIVGGVGGAVIGDQNRRNAEQAANQPPPPPPPPPPVYTQTVIVQQNYSTGSVLGRLIGHWRITGSIDAGNGAVLPVFGTADAFVDKIYFVRVDIHFTDPRNGQPIDGTSVISQLGDRRLEMTNSFSSSPQIQQFKGDADASGSVLNFSQFDPPGMSKQIVIRMLNGPGWTADVWNQGKRLETYTFTP